MDETLRDVRSAIKLLEQIAARLEPTTSDKSVANGAGEDSVLLVKVFDKTLRTVWKGNGECNRCGSQILWVETPKGKNMPVDPQPDAKGHYTSHFGSCPKH